MFDDYITLGPTPPDEDCAQVGEPNFRKLATVQMKAYVNQLNRRFDNWVKDGYILFDKKWFNHDFGSYGEVVVYYNTEDEMSRMCAISVDRSIPTYWDEEALKELEENQ